MKPKPSSNFASPQPVTWLALAVFVLALGIRLFGIGWGLKNDLHNQSYHPDEGPIFTYSQAIEPAQLKFTPGFYNYGTLYLTVLKVASIEVATYTGGPDPKNEDSTWGYVARCELAGRIVNAVAGAGMAAVLLLMVARFAGLLGGGLAGLFIAIAPAHIVHSRFQTVDIFAAFLLALSAHYALKLFPQTEAEKERYTSVALKLVILSGLFAGLSAGTKYTGILIMFCLTAAIWMSEAKNKPVLTIAGWLTCVLAFLIATPGAVLQTDQFVRDFSYEVGHTATGHGLVFVGTPSGFVEHVQNLVIGLGPGLFFVAIIGIGLALYDRQKWIIALLCFCVPYYIAIGRAEVKFLRYTFPLYVGLAATYGYAFSRLAKNAQKDRLSLATLSGLTAMTVFGGALTATLRMTQWMMNEDPRDTAARKLKVATSQDPNAVVGLAVDPWYWSVPLYPNIGLGPMYPWDQKMEIMRQATNPKVVYHTTAGEEGGPFPFDVRLLTQDQPTYVTMTSGEYYDVDRIKDLPGLKPLEALQVDRYKTFRAELERSYVLDYDSGPRPQRVHDLAYIQPTVQIWKRKTAK